MKKILLLLIVLISMTGCTSVKDSTVEQIIGTALNSKYKLYNRVNKGYKYYLPRSLEAIKQDEYNVIISSRYYDYYLYVDLVSYYNKVDLDYKTNDKLYLSMLFDNNKEKTGIINITEVKDNKVIIEASYYYADMAVKVDKKDINEAVMNIISVLNSIDYQDDVIKSLLEEDVLKASEEKIDVFKTEISNDSQTLDVVDDTYTGNEEEDYDPDVIN